MCDEPILCDTGTDCYDCTVADPPGMRLWDRCPFAWTSRFHVSHFHDGSAGSHVLAGVIIAILLGIGVVSAVSLPLCCGIAKPQAKRIAVVVIFCGVVVCFIPFLTSLGACDALADDECDECEGGCTESERDSIKSGCGWILFFLIHLHFCGWIGIALGITAAAMGCCVFCQCCALAPPKPPVMQQGMPAGAVMGQAVMGQPVMVEK